MSGQVVKMWAVLFGALAFLALASAAQVGTLLGLCNVREGDTAPLEDCNAFKQCHRSYWVLRRCGPGTVYEVSLKVCVHKSTSKCGLVAVENVQKEEAKVMVVERKVRGKATTVNDKRMQLPERSRPPTRPQSQAVMVHDPTQEKDYNMGGRERLQHGRGKPKCLFQERATAKATNPAMDSIIRKI